LAAALSRLQQDIKPGAVLIDCSPQQIRLAAQRHKHFIQMPCGAGLTTRSLDAMREARADLIAPAPNRFIAHNVPRLEQQLFDIPKAQLKPEIPSHRATDGCAWKPMTVIKRFWILHQTILLDSSACSHRCSQSSK